MLTKNGQQGYTKNEKLSKKMSMKKKIKIILYKQMK